MARNMQVSGSYNISETLTKFCAFVGVKYNNLIVMHGLKNVK